MKNLILLIFTFVSVLLVVSLNSCRKNSKVSVLTKTAQPLLQAYHQDTMVSSVVKNQSVSIEKSVTIEHYFQFMDSLVKKYDSLTTYPLTEHLLVRANSWIIDTLQNTDYYRRVARDSFVFNQKKMIALPEGNSIVVPDSIQAKTLLNTFQNTRIDVNIPEFKLRIYEDSIKQFECLVRVGKDEQKFLEMSGRVQDLKTKTGEGRIVRHIRYPRYVNPVNNREYFVTKRDDDQVTKLPQIPFIETEINGIRNGQLIHTTTNPITLGKAYSNGCIGVSEADAWAIYYFSPIYTKVNIRYDLKIADKENDTVLLEDIYKYNKKN